MVGGHIDTEAMVGGQMTLNGLSEPLPCTFTFKSTRYRYNNLYEENLQVLSDKGSLVAIAIYSDGGDGFLSTVNHAYYAVQTCFAIFRETKGHYLKISFDNEGDGKPRAISLVRGAGSEAPEGVSLV